MQGRNQTLYNKSGCSLCTTNMVRMKNYARLKYSSNIMGQKGLGKILGLVLNDKFSQLVPLLNKIRRVCKQISHIFKWLN